MFEDGDGLFDEFVVVHGVAEALTEVVADLGPEVDHAEDHRAQACRREIDADQAAVEAARLRCRPILMTSFAFILGIVPLVKAKGAGAASRQCSAQRCSAA